MDQLWSTASMTAKQMEYRLVMNQIECNLPSDDNAVICGQIAIVK